MYQGEILSDNEGGKRQFANHVALVMPIRDQIASLQDKRRLAMQASDNYYFNNGHPCPQRTAEIEKYDYQLKKMYKEMGTKLS